MPQTVQLDFSKAEPIGQPQQSGSVSLDFGNAQPLDNGATSTPPSTAQISAVPQPTTFLGKFGRWAENVSNDIKYGTDTTGIGTVLKKMGAHGVYAGNPEAVGDFMASMPLGLLKSAKGTTEVAPHVIGGPQGKTWQGLKDVVGGGLQAMTIPGGFIAPEAGEATAKTLGEVSEAASHAPKAVAHVLSTKNVQEGLQTAVRGIVDDVADSAGVPVAKSKSLLGAIEETGTTYTQSQKRSTSNSMRLAAVRGSDSITSSKRSVSECRS